MALNVLRTIARYVNSPRVMPPDLVACMNLENISLTCSETVTALSNLKKIRDFPLTVKLDERALKQVKLPDGVTVADILTDFVYPVICYRVSGGRTKKIFWDKSVRQWSPFEVDFEILQKYPAIEEVVSRCNLPAKVVNRSSVEFFNPQGAGEISAAYEQTVEKNAVKEHPGMSSALEESNTLEDSNDSEEVASIRIDFSVSNEVNCDGDLLSDTGLFTEVLYERRCGYENEEPRNSAEYEEPDLDSENDTFARSDRISEFGVLEDLGDSEGSEVENTELEDLKMDNLKYELASEINAEESDGVIYNEFSVSASQQETLGESNFEDGAEVQDLEIDNYSENEDDDDADWRDIDSLPVATEVWEDFESKWYDFAFENDTEKLISFLKTERSLGRLDQYLQNPGDAGLCADIASFLTEHGI